MVSRVIADSAQGISRLSRATRSVADTAGDLQSLASRFNLVPSLRGRTIAYLQTGRDVEYYEYSRSGADMAATILGGTLVTYDSNFDTDTEQANLATAIAAGCDGIVLFPTSGASAAAAMSVANAAGDSDRRALRVFTRGGRQRGRFPPVTLQGVGGGDRRQDA
jgi:ABC-type sugar transport system substrate-binding protein